MTTVLHVGMPKTGTTSLQKTFASSTRALEGHGVFYPTGLGSSSCNHRILAKALMPAQKFPRHMAAFRSQEVADGLYEELLDCVGQGVKRLSPRVLLLSSETLFRGPRKEYLPVFEQAVKGLGGNNIRVAAYLRSPAGSYLALLQQRVKATHTLLPLRPPPYVRVLQSYGKMFGKQAVSPRVFEREKLHGNDIISDFHHSYLGPHGVPLAALDRKGDKNRSLSAESMALCVMFWSRFFAGADNVLTDTSRQLVRTLAKADQSVGPPRPKLKSAVAAFLDGLAAPQLQVLMDDWGITFSDYDYGRASAPLADHPHEAREIPQRISDVVEVNTDLLRQIADFMAKLPRFGFVGKYRAWFTEVARNRSPAV